MARGLHGLVVAANAFLLFLVQPLIGKALLPSFGGGAAVWTVCLLFFQATLLAGYLVAHLLATRVPPRAQGPALLALLALSLVALPIAPGPATMPGWPTPALLARLAACVGLPFLALAATGPLVQRWYEADRPGRAPWPLFALSNGAALAALLAYPLLIEPTTRLATQLAAWDWAYAAACLPFAWLAMARRGGAEPTPAQAAIRAAMRPAPAGRARALRWLALSAAGAALLATVTARITRDVAPLPLLWMAPLALYLSSFVIAFAGPRSYPRRTTLALLPVALAVFAALPALAARRWPLEALLALHLAAAFVAFVAAHGELARARPDSGDLTRYYLHVAAGGALGGLAVAVGAPLAFDTDPDLALAAFALAVAVAAPTLAAWRAERSIRGAGRSVATAVALVALAVALARGAAAGPDATVLTMRGFYGALRVEDGTWSGNPEPRRRLLHGGTLHGEQFHAADRLRWATTYYGPLSGAALAIFATRRDDAAQRVGVVGLGAGTLAAWGRAGDVYWFYEIDPTVIALAERAFGYLRSSPAQIEIAPGDARLALARESPQGYDVLAVDAFAGDAVPVHLLTAEAFALYFRHLAPGGMLAVHVSNRWLELAPVVAASAARAGRVARLVESPGDPALATLAASWVVVAESADALAFGVFDRRTEAIEIPPGFRPWTDDYSSLLAVFGRRRDDG